MDFDSQNATENLEVRDPDVKDLGGSGDTRGKKILIVVLTLIAVVAAIVFIMHETRGSAARPTSSLVFPTLDPAAMEAYKGKVVLVNFWATWCEPCRVEIPWLIEFQQKYGDRGFTIIGVAMDEEGNSAVAPFVEHERFEVNGKPQAMNYPIFLGNEQVAARFGGMIGYPTSVLVARDGHQVKRITGLISHDEIAKAIEALL